jgi:hypothetical protein
MVDMTETMPNDWALREILWLAAHVDRACGAML